MPSVAGWRAWYADGTEYESDTTPWSELPDDGVVVVMVYFDDATRRICTGDDWYFDLGDGSIGHNSNDDNATRYPNSSLKRGKWMPDSEYEAIVDLAWNS